jgi:hypothetical protein
MGKKLWNISIAARKIFHSIRIYDGPGAVSPREIIFPHPFYLKGEEFFFAKK